MQVIWFSEIKWAYLKTRKQQIISRFPHDWEVLFIEPIVLGKKNRFWPQKAGNVTYVTVPYYKGTGIKLLDAFQSLKPVRFIVEMIAGFWVRLLLYFLKFKTENGIVCTSNIYYAPIIHKLKTRLVLYDCNDFPLGFSTALSFAAAYFRKTLEIAQIVTTVSQKLKEDLEQFKIDTCVIVGNGVDYNLFSNPSEVGIPADVMHLPKPVVMYVGALSEWFDVDLVDAVAKAVKGSIVIIGPAAKSFLPAKERLLLNTNVSMLGEKKHSELAAYIKQADVCLIPFKKIPLINGLNPNKLYEYFACGKPVVTLDYSDEIEQLEPLLHVARTCDEFVLKVKQAIENPPDSLALKKIAHENSWDKKAAVYVELIQQYLHVKV